MRTTWPKHTEFTLSSGRPATDSGRPGPWVMFLEALTPQGYFFRGEGQNLFECEQQAYAAYRAHLRCPSAVATKHFFQAEGRTDGSGVCRDCRVLNLRAFTAEQLDQHCRVCDAPTLIEQPGIGFLCDQHILTPGLESRLSHQH